MASSACRRHASEIVNRRGRIDHRRKRRGVWRDHEILAEPALESEARDTEGGILIREIDVAGAECAFGNAPRHAALVSVFDLPVDDEIVGLAQQAPFRRFHQEVRHQVLEHRAGPRYERRAASHRRKRAGEVEPVVDLKVPFGDGNEAREPRLGSEQVIAGLVELSLADAVPDREKLSCVVEEKREVHCRGHVLGRFCDRREPADQVGGLDGRVAERASERINARERFRIGGWITRKARAQASKIADRDLKMFGRIGENRRYREERLERSPFRRLLHGTPRHINDLRRFQADPGQKRSRIARVALDARSRGRRPNAQLRARGIAALLRERLGHVVQGADAAGEVDNQRSPCRRANGRRFQARIERVRGIGELLSRHGNRARLVGDARERFPQEPDRVSRARPHPIPAERFPNQLAAAVGERDQIARQVAAVDRRDVSGLERAEIARVVPVVEMPAELFKSAQRGEGGFEAFQRFPCADPSQIVRREHGQERQTHVGRRGAVRHDRIRIFLKIVGRQPVVSFRDECLEESPGPPRCGTERERVGGGQHFGARRRRRKADRPRHNRRDGP